MPAALRARLDIPATLHGPAIARAVVRALVVGWGQAALADDAVLVISELVTNGGKRVWVELREHAADSSTGSTTGYE